MILFTLSNNKIEINTLEVLLFEEFRVLYERDETPDKSQVFKEFNYIYQCCDLKSAPNKDGKTGADLEREARDIAKLPETWRPDIAVLNAMKLYENTVPSISAKLLKEVLISMNFSVDVLKKLRQQIGKKLKQTEELTNDELLSLQNGLDKIMAIAATFNKNMSTLKETEKLVIQEETKDVVVGRGGKEITDSMNPDTSID